MLVFSGELNGYLRPCECTKPMLGGMARRGSLLKSLAAASGIIKVENGDLVQERGAQNEIKAETLVDMLSAMKYDVFVPGEKDFKLGMPVLRSLQERFSGKFLCANVKIDGHPLFTGTVEKIINLSGTPIKILLIGLFSERYTAALHAFDNGLNIEPPVIALQRLKSRFSRCNYKVVVLHGDETEARDLAAHFPDLSMILYAHAPVAPLAPIVVGHTTLAYCGERGRSIKIADLQVFVPASMPRIREVSLGQSWKDNPGITLLKRDYSTRVKRENLLEHQIQLRPANGPAFAGSAACAPCHQNAYQVWQSSSHSHALKTLEVKGDDRDPECTSCHVVGWKESGGFISRITTPQLANVGCESCHGPAKAHVLDNKRPPAGDSKGSCRNCHISEHSPGFVFQSYWSHIKHL